MKSENIKKRTEEFSDIDLIQRLEDVELNFIITFGRSGSTLLQSILNNHPEILATLEQQFFLVGYKYFHNKLNWSDSDITLFINTIWLRKKEMSYLWKIDEQKLRVDLEILRDSKSLNYKNACKLVYMNHQDFNSNTKIIIDKNPIYLAHVVKIKSIFPDSKFIILLRDYRSFYASIKNYHAKPFGNNLTYQFTWKIGAQKLLKYLKSETSNQIIIKYENLVDELEKAGEQLCAFLKVPFERNMLNYEDKNHFSTQDFSDQSKAFQDNINRNHGNISKKIIKDNAEKWKKELSKEEVRSLEILLGDYAQEWGYLKTRNYNALDKFKFYFVRFPFLVVSYFKAKIFVDIIYNLPLGVQRFIITQGNKMIQRRFKK